jgi:hypothetical protein
MTPHSERETVMSYEEKGTWVYLVVAIVGSTVYLLLVLPAFLGGTPVEQIDYVPAMLWVIGGAIVASIIGRILVEIFSPSESTRRSTAWVSASAARSS